MLDEGFVFNQLEHLEVCLCTLLFSNQLVRLLNASSKLKRLDISLTDVSLFVNSLFLLSDAQLVSLKFLCLIYQGHVPRDMDDWNQPSTVPECLLSSLQSLNWLEYTGEPQERDIVVYILKHALHLKTATITLTESDFTKLDMIKELARSSRASTTCELMFD